MSGARLRGARPRGALLAALALGVALGAAAARGDVPAGEGGSGLLLTTAETAPDTVLGTVGAVTRLDPHGFAAMLEVERVLVGGLAPGATPRIAWEEASSHRPPRFAAGQRLLVALEPLPGGSLWRSRFPQGDALAVGAHGRAALQDPDAASVDALARYLALSPDARESAQGVAALLALASDAHPVLAETALRELAGRPALGDVLGDAARGAYAALVADPGRPLALRTAALALAGERRLASLRGAIEPLAEPGGPLEAPAREALVRIDGSLPAESARSLAARSEPALRVIAVRFGGEALNDAALAGLAGGDADATVRVAAAETLLARRGPAALETALPLLFDPDPEARRQIAVRIARLGEAAVPALRDLFWERPYAEVSELGPTALGLSMAGPAGVAALQEIAADHPDEKRRKLAGLALGRLPEPGH